MIPRRRAGLSGYTAAKQADLQVRPNMDNFVRLSSIRQPWLGTEGRRGNKHLRLVAKPIGPRICPMRGGRKVLHGVFTVKSDKKVNAAEKV